MFRHLVSASHNYLRINPNLVPKPFYDLIKGFPTSQVVREFSCKCDTSFPWQYNEPDTCLARAFSEGKQTPRWLVVACIDSRLPTEKVLGIGSHQALVVRVAGASLKRCPSLDDPDRMLDDAWRSIIIGLKEFNTIQGVLFLGHSSCGASHNLLTHYNRSSTTHTGPWDRFKLYSDTDTRIVKQAKQYIENTDDLPDRFNGVAAVLRHAQSPVVDMTTLLGIENSARHVREVVEHVRGDLPVATCVVSLNPHHPETPVALLMQQPSGAWADIVSGPQPDVHRGIAACTGNQNAQITKNVIQIAQQV